MYYILLCNLTSISTRGSSLEREILAWAREAHLGEIIKLEAVSEELVKLPRTKPNTHRGHNLCYKRQTNLQRTVITIHFQGENIQFKPSMRQIIWLGLILKKKLSLSKQHNVPNITDWSKVFVQWKRSLHSVGDKQSNEMHRINRREDTKNLVTIFGQLFLRPRERRVATNTLLDNKDYKL
ncbi:hypothetical protein Lal_00023581 [Lupinus albus]|nr:hypothetical protein Lal_00023581 [Lupinus albus]